ncbi:TPA: hypothetical protein SMP92_002431 [Pseudomonas putida]|nr:hypothetical protein [Pseudomonas putida]
MSAIIAVVVTILIGIAVGVAADYWMFDKLIECALMAMVITLSLRVLRRSEV